MGGAPPMPRVGSRSKERLMSARTTTNHPRPLEPYNLYETDPVLRRAVEREGAGAADVDLAEFGALVGSEEVYRWGFEANRFGPELLTHDRFGGRIDEVRYHPSYHRLMELSVGAGIHASHYDGTPGDGSYVARTARMHLTSQIEVGHGCPISMTEWRMSASMCGSAAASVRQRWAGMA